MPTSAAGSHSVDVVIVGAGSAGCVLAERLSRHEKRSVLVLEQGPSEWPDADVLDLRRLPISDGERYVTPHREASGLPVVRGRGLGGSSTVNGGYFMRFHRGDFDSWQGLWTPDVIDEAYAEVEEKMGAHPFHDADLAPAALAFEKYWGGTYPTRPLGASWPLVGVNRVRSNSVDGIRRTAADAYLRPHLDRPNLRVRTGVAVESVLLAEGNAVGVMCDGQAIRAREVILCAGTLGSAAVLLRSGVTGERMRVREHREVLVGYRLREQLTSGPLLPTVVHTDDGLEIRCYRDDFARYIGGLAVTGPAVGVAAMTPGASGEVYLDGGGVGVRLDRPDARVLRHLSRTAREVVEMLRSSSFGELVVADSIAIDPVLRTSQHAWGSMPMGGRTDWLGGVRGVGHLRVVDGSILPSAGRSGPHATTMMVAAVIGDVLSA